MAITVTGGAELAVIAAACRSLSVDKSIVKDMAKGIRKGIPPIRRAIKVRAVEILPHGGGFGSWVAKSSVRSIIRLSSRSADVRIRGSRTGRADKNPRIDLTRIDQGRARHPTWGHKPWVLQTVRSGFFTDAVTKTGQDYLERAVLVAAEHAAERILHA